MSIQNINGTNLQVGDESNLKLTKHNIMDIYHFRDWVKESLGDHYLTNPVPDQDLVKIFDLIIKKKVKKKIIDERRINKENSEAWFQCLVKLTRDMKSLRSKTK
jgi:hypothetical protein